MNDVNETSFIYENKVQKLFSLLSGGRKKNSLLLIKTKLSSITPLTVVIVVPVKNSLCKSLNGSDVVFLSFRNRRLYWILAPKF